MEKKDKEAVISELLKHQLDQYNADDYALSCRLIASFSVKMSTKTKIGSVRIIRH